MKPLDAESIEVEVESVNSRGDGVARLGSERFVMFVPGALPGETVWGKVSLLKRSYGVMDIHEIRQPHPERINPKCPWYGRCGGCAFQHASYDLQLEMKERTVREAFSKIARFYPDQQNKCLGSPKEWNYRNKASFPVRPYGLTRRIGFFSQGSHELIPIDECPVLENKIGEWIRPLSRILESSQIEAYDERTHSGFLRHLVARCGSCGDSSLLVPVIRFPRKEAFTAEVLEFLDRLYKGIEGVGGIVANYNSAPGNTIFGGHSRLIEGNGGINEKLGGFNFRYGPTSFFQVNTRQAEALFNTAVMELESFGSERVLELYSGTGALTLFIAKNRKMVHAVEEWSESCTYLKENANLNDMKNIRIMEMSSEKAIKILAKCRFDAVVVDPPRKGCSEEVLKGICSMRPEAVIYISCNPATLARDSVLLMNNGYNLQKIQVFDMFPQTFHVESLATFNRKRPSVN